MNQQETIRMQSQRDPAQIEQEIEQQRNHIDDIVQALESRLSPGEMLDRVLSVGKGGGREFTGNLADAVKSNPVPALVTAAGMMWLYSANKASTTTVETTTVEVSTTGEGSRTLADRMQSAKSTVGEKAHGAAGSIRSGASTAKQKVAGGMQTAGQGYGEMLRTNPLGAAAIAVAVGAVLGALIPPTRKEDELLGETSDRLIDKVKTTAQEHKEQLAQHAREETAPRESQGSEQGTQDLSQTAAQGNPASPYGSQRAH